MYHAILRLFFKASPPAELPEMGIMSENPFINFLFLNCRFSNKHTLQIYLTAPGNVTVVRLFIKLVFWA